MGERERERERERGVLLEKEEREGREVAEGVVSFAVFFGFWSEEEEKKNLVGS